MRAAELFQTIPNLIFVLTIVVILGSTLTNIVIAIGIVSWTSIARMTRAEFLALRDREFVQACRAMGMGDCRIIVGEILPNALPPVIVLSSLVVAAPSCSNRRCRSWDSAIPTSRAGAGWSATDGSSSAAPGTSAPSRASPSWSPCSAST